RASAYCLRALFFHAEDGIRAFHVTGVQTCALPIFEAVDIVTDVTWSPATGAETACAAIEHGKDVVLVNIEADVTVERILRRKARSEERRVGNEWRPRRPPRHRDKGDRAETDSRRRQ